jgi:DeoR family glycerol-3-phosphate regulon repressor
MKPSRNASIRQTAILKHLQKHGRALVEELAELFDTTPQTIRKDLTTLEEENQIARFHGGATLISGIEYTSFSTRQEIARDEKERIAQLTAEQIPNNASIIINAGTTTTAVALKLEHHIGLRVVTDSVDLATKIRGFAGIEVMVPAGVVRRSDGAILGTSAVDFIRQFRVDIAVIGVAAIADDGALLDYDLRQATVARAIIENARAVILAADSTKFARLAPVRIGHLSQLDTLVTDTACPQALRQLCEQQRLRLLTA